MKVLIDTDVLLDVALNRTEFVEDSAAVLRWAEAGGEACIAWHSVAKCAYLLKNDGRDFLNGLLEIVAVASVGEKDAKFALQLPLKDLDDALQVAAATAWGVDCIITRNIKDYKKSPLKVMTPKQFLKQIEDD